MATQEKRGWIWTSDEKEWMKTWKRTLHKNHDSICVQLHRFKESLPDYAEKAAKAAQPFLNSCEPLLSLNEKAAGKKYQSMSPEEAKQKLNVTELHFKEFASFINSSEIQQAIKDTTEARIIR